MKLSRDAWRDNLFYRFFLVSQRHNFIFAWNCLMCVPINSLSLSLLKSDVIPKDFDCEKTELSGITDRSHEATVTRRLGMPKLQCWPDGYVGMCAGADNQEKIERIHPPLTSSKNRLKSFCEVDYANFRSNLFCLW